MVNIDAIYGWFQNVSILAEKKLLYFNLLASDHAGRPLIPPIANVAKSYGKLCL